MKPPIRKDVTAWMTPRSDFATCDLCDAHKGDTDGAFRVLPPVFRDFGKRAHVLPGR